MKFRRNSLWTALTLCGIVSSSVLGQKRSDSTPQFQLFNAGDPIVDYSKYGTFTNPGTPAYRYFIRDRDGLAKAVGEGIYPNVTGLLKDPNYEKAQYAGQLE